MLAFKLPRQLNMNPRPAPPRGRARVGVVLLTLSVLAACAVTGRPTGSVADAAPAGWPQWRGPTWNGVAAPQADPPIRWSETENLRWKTRIEGNGHGTPIVWGDRIFLLSAIALDKEMPVPDVIPKGTPNINEHPQVVGTWKPQRLVVLCVDRVTGKQ